METREEEDLISTGIASQTVGAECLRARLPNSVRILGVVKSYWLEERRVCVDLEAQGCRSKDKWEGCLEDSASNIIVASLKWMR